ncbi:MAG: nicotinate-nucleotide adenylyltransferase [Xanthomonadaceae bacterium]|jgi:nicotinate-nucleotide adenylyltransferase|nr:nicotinate-nucleotide adenylyltransferase [Xanthomonadaceae bacterium]
MGSHGSGLAATAQAGAGPVHVVYGGTFDPVHLGHLAIARAARDALRATVHLTPAADPPHRAPPGADAAHRARMVALAIAGEPGLALDARELRREGPSYTVDTLRELRREGGAQAPIALLLGADSLLGLPDWHAWRELPGLAHLVVAEREGSDLDARLPPPLADCLEGRWTRDPADLAGTPAGRVLRLHQPLHPGSATQVRRALASGGDWRAWLPAAVAEHIRRHGLYGVTVP